MWDVIEELDIWCIISTWDGVDFDHILKMVTFFSFDIFTNILLISFRAVMTVDDCDTVCNHHEQTILHQYSQLHKDVVIPLNSMEVSDTCKNEWYLDVKLAVKVCPE